MTKQEAVVRLDLYAQELDRMGDNLTRIFEGLDGTTEKDRDLFDLLSDATDRIYSEGFTLRLLKAQVARLRRRREKDASELETDQEAAGPLGGVACRAGQDGHGSHD